MATFKVGQRVRVIESGDPRQRKEFIGCEGVIVAIPSASAWFDPTVCECDVQLAGETLWSPFANLAPLTDPRADEFIADMERYAHVAATTPKREPIAA